MENIEDRISLKLKRLDGVDDYEDLKPFMKEYLKRIEEIIINKEAKERTAIEELRNNKISVASISQELGCSRTTLYNHNSFLKRYIEVCIESIEEQNPFIKYDKLKGSTAILEEKVNKMIMRDIDTELLRMENKKLGDTLKEKMKEIERLQIRNAEILKELQGLKSDVQNRYKEKITKFPIK